MSNNHLNRKPSPASENLISTIAALFFISLAVLFLWLDDKKHPETDHQATESQPVPQPSASNSKPEAQQEDADWQEHIERSLNAHGDIAGNFAASMQGQSVNAPIPALDITPQEFQVNAGAGQLFTSKHQSVISIPPNAFIDKEGKAIVGNVDVQYREFYNYLDFFLSGIPMKYDSGSSGRQLESAGMFELTASANNEPVYVNQQNKINVMMATMNRSPGYNLYYFDKTQNRWIYKGNSTVTVSQQGNQGWKFSDEKKDSVERRFAFKGENYSVRLYSILEPAPKRKFLQLKKPLTERFTFHFIGSRKSIPELNELRAVTWMYTGTDATEVYRRLFGYKNYVMMLPRPWRNLTIQHVDEDDTYLLTLFDVDDTVSVKILPRLSTEKIRQRFNARFADFTTAQDVRISAEQSRYEKFIADTMRYFAENSRYETTNRTPDYYAMRQFEVDGFGIWNCDRPIEMPTATTLIANFIDSKNNPLQPVRVFLADKSINTVYSYDSKTLSQFKFNPASQNLVWALFPNNVIAVIKPKEFREKYANAKWRCLFKVELDENEIVSQKDLKQKLAFDM